MVKDGIQLKKLMEQVERFLTPPKFHPDMYGKDCFWCGHPLPNSKGIQVVLDAIGSAYQIGRDERQ